ncbi:MAG: asparagine--tRNA ligase [Candidatus Neomarinimicrobiota bacterium]|nr:asparagine--tRNA ligase [Candidatus Neomarinimicrobiota bacterium]
MKTTISELKKYDGKEVSLDGWVYNIRSIGKIWFLILRDGTGLVQCVVVDKETDKTTFELENTLTQESSVTIDGIVRSEPRSVGGYELGVTNITIHQIADEYPISHKEHGADFLMSNRHLWLRSKNQNAILKIRHQAIKATRDFFDDNGFVLMDSPILTANSVEGTSTLFELDYFDRSAYLTQSGQLYGEASAMAFGKIYVFGPTFRAEKSKTRRHLTEFWMVEPEMAYCDLNENMDWAEKHVSYVVQWCLEHCQEELKILERDTSKLEKTIPPFPRITYDEAVNILKKQDIDFKYGSDFGGADETVISEEFDRPVMIHRWPSEIKAFYMKRDPENDKLALGVDMIAPEGFGEIVGGGQREDDHDILLSRIKEHKLPIEPFQWYLDLRKYGSVPHSGYGLGIERTVGWICGTKHVRETIPYPRTIYRIEP